MNDENSFRSIEGRWYLLPEKLVLIPKNSYKKIDEMYPKDGIVFGEILFSLIITFFFIFLTLFYYFNKEILMALLFGLGSLIIFILAIISLVNKDSRTPVIFRDKIIKIKFIRGISDNTIIIFFKNTKGRNRRRVILLSNIFNGKKNLQKAKEILGQININQ